MTFDGKQRPDGPARGYRTGHRKRVCVPFDMETFDIIRARANADQTSFAEQVRLLCEWGLESLEMSE